MTVEEKALLDMIAFSEGTLGVSQNGYDVLVGSKRIMAGWVPDTTIVHMGSDWLDSKTKSSAAGRYQFLKSTWVGGTKEKPGINLPMTKNNQNKRALEIINSVISNIDKTKLSDRDVFNNAINRLSTQWASIPVVRDITDSSGNIHRAGKSYYAGDGVNHAVNADKLFEVFNKALTIYKKLEL